MELDWEKNLGTTDRIIRIVIGATLLVLVITKNVADWWATGAIILAIIQFVEAFLDTELFMILWVGQPVELNHEDLGNPRASPISQATLKMINRDLQKNLYSP